MHFLFSVVCLLVKFPLTAVLFTFYSSLILPSPNTEISLYNGLETQPSSPHVLCMIFFTFINFYLELSIIFSPAGKDVFFFCFSIKNVKTLASSVLIFFSFILQFHYFCVAEQFVSISLIKNTLIFCVFCFSRCLIFHPLFRSFFSSVTNKKVA